jgi:AAT family amino acid transporter
MGRWHVHIVTLVAAFSCANSGLYGTVRSLYGCPSKVWAEVPLQSEYFQYSSERYLLYHRADLARISSGFASDEWDSGERGPSSVCKISSAFSFTGTLCWVGICMSQVIFRKRLKERGYDPNEVLTVKANNGIRGLAYFAIVLQIAAMILLVFEEGGNARIYYFIDRNLCTDPDLCDPEKERQNQKRGRSRRRRSEV